MTHNSKIKDVADTIKGIAEAVPVYQDVVQPAAKEVGTALQTVAKSVHVALAPISALVWGYDKIRDYLSDRLAEKLANLPKGRIITPSPVVAVPAIEALRICGNEPTLREMYANLIAKSMDAETAPNAHPAFVETIRQLTPDEARIITYMAGGFGNPVAAVSGSVYITVSPKTGNLKSYSVFSYTHFSMLQFRSGLRYPNQIESYFDNLQRLAMIQILPYESVDPTGSLSLMHKILESQPQFVGVRDQILKDMLGQFGAQEVDIEITPYLVKEIIRLTSFGLQFCDSCISEADRGNRLEEAEDLTILFGALLDKEPDTGSQKRIRNQRKKHDTGSQKQIRNQRKKR